MDCFNISAISFIHQSFLHNCKSIFGMKPRTTILGCTRDGVAICCMWLQIVRWMQPSHCSTQPCFRHNYDDTDGHYKLYRNGATTKYDIHVRQVESCETIMIAYFGTRDVEMIVLMLWLRNWGCNCGCNCVFVYSVPGTTEFGLKENLNETAIFDGVLCPKCLMVSVHWKTQALCVVHQ